jgi:hypothetical protein
MKTPDLHDFETTMKARYVAKFLLRLTCGLAKNYLEVRSRATSGLVRARLYGCPEVRRVGTNPLSRLDLLFPLLTNSYSG